MPPGRASILFLRAWGPLAGSASSGFPAGKGPFPSRAVIHSRCWRSNIAKLSIMNAAGSVGPRGSRSGTSSIAGIEPTGGSYRHLPGRGGQRRALRGIAAVHHLEIDRVVALGHSAGGHLAFYLARRAPSCRCGSVLVERPSAAHRRRGLPGQASGSHHRRRRLRRGSVKGLVDESQVNAPGAPTCSPTPPRPCSRSTRAPS